jgi:hypothetical protein
MSYKTVIGAMLLSHEWQQSILLQPPLTDPRPQRRLPNARSGASSQWVEKPLGGTELC